jgi:acetate---CoA ligase (ADP-forming)
MIVGAVRDPTFGAIVRCGVGGVRAEQSSSATYFPAPVTKLEAVEGLSRATFGHIFTEYRGEASRDLEALAGIVAAVADLMTSDASIVEIDLNPVMTGVSGAGAAAADALVVRMADHAAETEEER